MWFYQVGLNAYDTVKYNEEKEEIREKFAKRIKDKDPESGYVQKQRLKRNRKLAKVDRTIKEGNLMMRWGEPLAVFDSSLVRQTTEQFELYMNSIGFFQADVSSNTKSLAKLVTLTYDVDKGPPYIIDSLEYNIEDDVIASLIAENSEEGLIEVGANYNQATISAERERLYNVLVNNGYFDFSRQFIQFEVDTISLSDNRVLLRTEILGQNDDREHKVFTTDQVNFITDANLQVAGGKRTVKEYNGIRFQFIEDKYNRRILESRLLIQKDSLFRRSNTLTTQRQLANLDMFKFINVNYDTTGGQFVANIFTSPLEKYQTSGEVGVNVSQGLPGPFVNGLIKNRNVFGGLEILELTGRFGVEGVASASNEQDVYQSTELGLNASLLFPQFLFPLSKRLKRKVRNLEPKTNINTGLTFTNRPEYNRNSFQGAITYSWLNKRNKIYRFSPAEITYINSDIKSNTFQAFLDDLESRGNLLKNTFRPSYVSAMSFSVINNFNQYGNLAEVSSFLRYSIESGGTTQNFFEPQELTTESLEFYKYLKFNVDYRFNDPISSKVIFAYRVNLGLAYPYDDNKILPYEKYFFAGGSNGIRAWRPRRLGPGSYTPLDENGLYTDNFEQQGEILIESSIELRHNILGFIDGAIFMDLGNIWTLRNDPTRDGAQFEINRFFREIAIGTGYGLRLDFSFLLLRFDAGLKIFDPARDSGNRFIWDPDFNSEKFQASENLVFNIGIGYPF